MTHFGVSSLMEREISPQSSHYFLNACAVDKVGEYDLTLEFVGQRYQWLAFAVSGLTVAAIGVAVAWGLLRARRMGSPVDREIEVREAAGRVSDGD